MHNLSVILLAGGLGQRFDPKFPKQFHFLNSKRIALYSLECFLEMEEVSEIIIVTSIEYLKFFPLKCDSNKLFDFALPGNRRQDSVYNGLQKIKQTNNLVCIHDAARPFINPTLVRKISQAANDSQGSAAGVPLKFTVKNIDDKGFVEKTLDRSKIWEIQTPQIIPHSLLKKGFEKSIRENITVTDDVALLELLGEKVKLVEACFSNLKITTKEDLIIAENILKGLMNAQL